MRSAKRGCAELRSVAHRLLSRLQLEYEPEDSTDGRKLHPSPVNEDSKSLMKVLRARAISYPTANSIGGALAPACQGVAPIVHRRTSRIRTMVTANEITHQRIKRGVRSEQTAPIPVNVTLTSSVPRRSGMGSLLRHLHGGMPLVIDCAQYLR